MATYFVDPVNGSDSTGSGSVGAPYKTLAKTVGASGVAAAGDTVVLIPSGPARQSVTFGVAGSSGSPITIIGDYDGARQVAASAATVYTGYPVWSSYNATPVGAASDFQQPVGACAILNGKTYLTFQSIMFIGGTGGNATCVDGTTSHSHDVTFTNCSFQDAGSGQVMINYTEIANIAANWTIDRCIILKPSNSASLVQATLVDPAVATDVDVNFLIKNSVLHSMGSNAVRVSGPATVTNTGKPGGVRVRMCTLVASTCFNLTGAAMSTTTPCEVYDSLLMGGTGLTAAATGQINEDFNLNYCGTARTSTTAGASSLTGTSQAPLFHTGAWLLFDKLARPFLSPMVPPGSTQSPLTGFGASSVFTAYSNDVTNRPRPSGGAVNSSNADVSGTATSGANGSLTDSGKSWTTNQWSGYKLKLTGGTGNGQYRTIISNTATVLTITPNWTTNPDSTSGYTITNPGNLTAVGAYERHNHAVKETTTVDTRPSSIRHIGPGDNEFLVPVDAVSSTVTVKVRRDSNYGGGTKPTLKVLANSEIGITSDQTTTDAGAANTWNTLSLTFTPTSKGWVRVRLDATGSAGNGNTYWDTASVPTLSSTAGTEGFDYFLRGEPFPALTHDGGGAGGLPVVGSTLVAAAKRII